jgi:DNA-nicking Smr family endonuclease
MTKRNKEEEESQLFLDAVKDVKPLKHGIAELRTKQLPALRQRRSVPVIDDSQADFLDADSFVRSGVQANVVRRLRRGQIPIEAELDLHGFTSREAEAKIRAFLLSARVPNRQRGVRIIHGRGHGSPDGKSVLKGKTRQWLRDYEAVLAFCPAGTVHGGTGAVHVLLRKK